MKLYKKLFSAVQQFFFIVKKESFCFACQKAYRGSLLRFFLRFPHVLRLRSGVLAVHHNKNRQGLCAEMERQLFVDCKEEVSIIDYCTSFWEKKKDFGGTRTVIMAHDDPEGIIDPYVKNICRSFKTQGFYVVISSSAPLAHVCDGTDYSSFADAIICHTCQRNRFVAWKAAFAYYPSLFTCTEVLLTCDEYFGPFGFFEASHACMEQYQSHCWSMTSSFDSLPRLHSHYLVCCKEVLQHPFFAQFLQALPLTVGREHIAPLEKILTYRLASCGFTLGAYCYAGNPLARHIYLPYFFYEYIMDCGVPLLVRERIFTTEGYNTCMHSEKISYDSVVWNCVQEYLLRLASLPASSKSVSMQDVMMLNGERYKDYDAFPKSTLPLYVPFKKDSTCAPAELEARLAVAIHCYYPEVLPLFLPYVKNIPSHAHIYFTTDTEEKKQAILLAMREYSFGKIEVKVCPNIGWDMAPFFVGLADVLDDYTYILKLHVKKSTHLNEKMVTLWRAVLYDSLLGTEERVRTILAQFNENEKLGVVAPPTYPPFALPLQGSNAVYIEKILQKKQLSIPEDACLDFPVGGMFWCRSKALQPWLTQGITYQDFELTDAAQRDGSFAHAMERLIFLGAGLEGMQWTRVRM